MEGSSGGCYETRGSQLQVQLYVNRYRLELDSAVLAAPELSDFQHRLAGKVRWVSPVEETGYAEYRDGAFLEAIGRRDLSESLREFWPARGPVWDGLATADLADAERGILLIEGKSYPGEMRAGSSKAGIAKGGEPPSERSAANRGRIRARLQEVASAYGASPPDQDTWQGPYYQTANRLAYLHWLSDRCHVPAWLVYLLFTGDETTQPTPEDEWHTALVEARRGLGLASWPAHVAHVILPARSNAR
jgi:hypothetical protein